MTPLPGALGGSGLVAWRLDASRHAGAWDTGEGAFRFGGRWNSPGVRAVYCSLDPATAILEVAVHKRFEALDTVAHTLTEVEIVDPARVHVVDPQGLPNSRWLQSVAPSAGQQRYGDTLLQTHAFVVMPSVVSPRSWNLVFVAANAASTYRMKAQERFALDTRLHPPS